MGRRLRMCNEALGVAEIVGDADDGERVGDPERGSLPASDLEGHDRAAAFHLPLGERCLRMVGAARIERADTAG